MADNVLSGMSQPILIPGMTVTLEALDPTTGAVNTAVVISDVVISGDHAGGDPADLLEPGTPAWVWGDDTGTV
jgi:hypothetical protein